MTTATVMDGRAVCAMVLADLRRRVDGLLARQARPGLGTVLVGADPGSRAYVAGKHRDCAATGVGSPRPGVHGSGPGSPSTSRPRLVGCRPSASFAEITARRGRAVLAILRTLRPSPRPPTPTCRTWICSGRYSPSPGTAPWSTFRGRTPNMVWGRPPQSLERSPAPSAERTRPACSRGTPQSRTRARPARALARSARAGLHARKKAWLRRWHDGGALQRATCHQSTVWQDVELPIWVVQTTRSVNRATPQAPSKVEEQTSTPSNPYHRTYGVAAPRCCGTRSNA